MSTKQGGLALLNDPVAQQRCGSHRRAAPRNSSRDSDDSIGRSAFNRGNPHD